MTSSNNSNISNYNFYSDLELYGAPNQNKLEREQMEKGWDEWTYALGFRPDGELLGCKEVEGCETPEPIESRVRVSDHPNAPMETIRWDKDPSEDWVYTYHQYRSCPSSDPSGFGGVELERGMKYATEETEGQWPGINRFYTSKRVAAKVAAWYRQDRAKKLLAYCKKNKKALMAVMKGIKERQNASLKKVNPRTIRVEQWRERGRWQDEVKLLKSELSELRLLSLKEKGHKAQIKRLEKDLEVLLNYKGPKTIYKREILREEVRGDWEKLYLTSKQKEMILSFCKKELAKKG